MIRTENLSGGYGDKKILHDVNVEVKGGEFFGILGPNGSGKTTLLKMISGLLKAETGDVFINGKNLTEYTMKELARLMAVLPQLNSQAFNYKVKDTVSLGRYAHQTGFFKNLTEKDEAIIVSVMEQTGIHHYADNFLNELSGGERQRVFLAQALAQEPKVLLLDEPTNHLDLSHQKDLLDYLKKTTKETGLTVISIFHDLNLAGLYCDRLLLMEEGSVSIINHPEEVLREDRISSVYNTKIEKNSHPKVAKPQMYLIPARVQEETEWWEMDERYLTLRDDMITLNLPKPVKTMSSGVCGAGLRWSSTIVNRHVPDTYDCDDYIEDMENFLLKKGFDPFKTVGMMTAVKLEDVSYRKAAEGNVSVFVVVTAGVGNAVDISRNSIQAPLKPGTINTWVLVNGELSDEAFIQAIVTATEAKVKALQDEKVKDESTNTLATGTSTDSILIGATQRGEFLPFSGPITKVGKMIGTAVYETTREAIGQYKRRKGLL
ncbi:adenosylcobinamide amidohydrolase [Bacillus sp. SG-1]|uniref:adenosylcobinamide amidohydrolase n=1 Tax=Bacillus sp. SG-1 TaxID=161544 RepID=UPI0001544081|nr:adenosylcobinamide amidohydrolase [Bacillus sp. SG-1]EDL66220.1 iron(III) dicitrate transport system (permease) [Bacillus sp. SG-1]